MVTVGLCFSFVLSLVFIRQLTEDGWMSRTRPGQMSSSVSLFAIVIFGDDGDLQRKSSSSP